MTDVTIIDCRFPYEFEGGHIQGAINIFTLEGLAQFWRDFRSRCVEGKQQIIMLHCEFSQARGPHMQSCLQSMIDEDDVHVKPDLTLLSGGYRKHYAAMVKVGKRQVLGGAKGYTPMRRPPPDLDVDALRALIDTPVHLHLLNIVQDILQPPCKPPGGTADLKQTDEGDTRGRKRKRPGHPDP